MQISNSFQIWMLEWSHKFTVNIIINTIEESMSQKQVQRGEAPKKLRKLIDLCIHKHKYLTSHSSCEGYAQMCSERCPRAGHVDEAHDCIEIEELLVKVRQIKESKLQITGYLFDLLDSIYKQQQEILYNRYRQAKQKIQILCFQDEEQIKLIQLIDVGKLERLDCSHVYYLKNIATDKQEVNKQANEIIKNFKDCFQVKIENKAPSQELNKEKLTEIISIMKNTFQTKIDEERRNYLNKHLDMESQCRKIQAQCKSIRKKYERSQAKLAQLQNGRPNTAMAEEATVTNNEPTPKKPEPKQPVPQNIQKPENKPKNPVNSIIVNPPNNSSTVFPLISAEKRQKNELPVPIVPKSTSLHFAEPPSNPKPKMTAEQLELKQKIKQKILKEKQQKIKLAQKNQQPPSAEPNKQIIFKPLPLVSEQQKLLQPTIKPPVFANFEIPIKQTQLQSQAQAQAFSQAIGNIQNKSFSLFVDSSQEKKSATKIGQEIKVHPSPGKPIQQEISKPSAEEIVPPFSSSSSGIFQKHRQYEIQKREKLLQRQKNQNPNKNTFNYSQYIFGQTLNNPSKTPSKVVNQVQKQQQSEQQFGLFDKPKSSNKQKMQDNDDQNYLPVFSDAMKSNTDGGFYFKKKMESNNANNSNTGNNNGNNDKQQ